MIDSLPDSPNSLSELSVSLSECYSLSAYASLSETPAAPTFLFFVFSPETEVENTLIHNEGNIYCIKIKLNIKICTNLQKEL